MKHKAEALVPSRVCGKLKKSMTTGRYTHTAAVAARAARLAERYKYDVKKAALAAFLHDCAKDMKREKLKRIITASRDARVKSFYPVAQLWHSAAGPFIARRDYGIRDREVLDAILYHSTGWPGMGTLAKIIFVADFAAEGRRFKGPLQVARISERKNITLDKLVRYVLVYKQDYLIKAGHRIHPASVRLLKKLDRK